MSGTTTGSDAETGGTGPGHRSVSLSRTAHGEFDVTNVRGGTIHIGTGETDDFTPVELLLTAIAGCSAVDVDFITSRRAEPGEFTVTGTLKTWDIMDRLPEITVPALLVGGRYDECTPGHLADMHARIAGSELVTIEDASHLCFAEQPAEFNQKINRFFDRTEAAIRP